MPWAWGGEGRPRSPGGYWAAGDDVIGDPPHEPQGWYSVFDADLSTLALLGRGSADFLQGGGGAGDVAANQGHPEPSVVAGGARGLPLASTHVPPTPPWPPQPPDPPPRAPPPPVCHSAEADDTAVAGCESWCSDTSHCAFCKCRGCAKLACAADGVGSSAGGGAGAAARQAPAALVATAACHSTFADDVAVETCESWCDPKDSPSHCEYCKCKGCAGCAS